MFRWLHKRRRRRVNVERFVAAVAERPGDTEKVRSLLYELQKELGLNRQRPMPPRRVSVPGPLNANIYRRADGKYEVGWRDTDGRQRWQSPFETIEQARTWRSLMVGYRESFRRGEVPRP